MRPLLNQHLNTKRSERDHRKTTAVEFTVFRLINDRIFIDSGRIAALYVGKNY